VGRSPWERFPQGLPVKVGAVPLSVQGVTLGCMSTDDQKLSAVIQGQALKAARDEVPQEILDRLAAAAEGRDDLRIRTAGEVAGL
jgi:hypothetical protein